MSVVRKFQKKQDNTGVLAALDREASAAAAATSRNIRGHRESTERKVELARKEIQRQHAELDRVCETESRLVESSGEIFFSFVIPLLISLPMTFVCFAGEMVLNVPAVRSLLEHSREWEIWFFTLAISCIVWVCAHYGGVALACKERAKFGIAGAVAMGLALLLGAMRARYLIQEGDDPLTSSAVSFFFAAAFVVTITWMAAASYNPHGKEEKRLRADRERALKRIRACEEAISKLEGERAKIENSSYEKLSRKQDLLLRKFIQAGGRPEDFSTYIPLAKKVENPANVPSVEGIGGQGEEEPSWESTESPEPSLDKKGNAPYTNGNGAYHHAENKTPAFDLSHFPI